MTEREQLEERIQKMYVDKGEHTFEDKKEAQRFVKNAAYYVESEFQSECHYNYVSLMEFLGTSKADAVIYGVATKDYEWFL